MKFAYSALLASLTFAFLYTPIDAAPLTLGFDQSSYETGPGGTVDVQLILRDTDPGDSFDLSSEGLITGGGKILQTGGDAALTPSGVSANSGFEFSTTYPNDAPFPGGFDSQNVAGLSALSTDGPVGVGLNEIVLGTFSLEVNGALGDSATISASTFGGSFVANVSGSGMPLDEAFDFDFETAQINAVPEPTSIALFGIGALGLGVCSWRRRKRRSAA